MDAGECSTGEHRVDDSGPGPDPETEPKSLSRRRARPVADSLEVEEARLLAENFRTEDFFFCLDEGSEVRKGEAGRSSIPEKEGDCGRVGTLEQTPEMGVPLPAPAAREARSSF